MGKASGSKRSRASDEPSVVVGFSGFKDPRVLRQWRTMLEGTLKASVLDENAKDVSGCTHIVICRPVTRTAKLCQAISLPAIRLVTDDWVKACESAKSCVDSKPHELAGEYTSAAAGLWSFNATVSRRRAADGHCLAGHTFFVTPCDAPEKAGRHSDEELRLIVRAGGGELLEHLPSASSGPVVVVSTEEERKSWGRLAKMRNVTPIKAGHLLSCVLRQELDLSAGRLE